MSCKDKYPSSEDQLNLIWCLKKKVKPNWQLSTGFARKCPHEFVHLRHVRFFLPLASARSFSYSISIEFGSRDAKTVQPLRSSSFPAPLTLSFHIGQKLRNRRRRPAASPAADRILPPPTPRRRGRVNSTWALATSSPRAHMIPRWRGQTPAEAAETHPSRSASK